MAENPSARRTFLKTTAATVATTALASGAVAVPTVHAANNDTIKVGLIGCGGRGKGAGEDVLRAAKGVEIIALGDAFEDRLKNCHEHLENYQEKKEVQNLGNKVDVPPERRYVGLDAYQKVIDTPGVNYIILATPPGFRPIHLEAAVKAGKTIFTEK